MNLKPLRKVADYLFKEINLYDMFNPLILCVFICIIKFVFIGIESDALTTYFEIIVVLLLIFILGMQIPIKSKGYILWVNLLMMFSGAIWFLCDNPVLLIDVTIRIYTCLICFHIVYLIINFVEKIPPKKRPIIIRKVRWKNK